ncbi:MAG TPA: hypothetical protein DCM87_16595, partial [Planctomycetes bacterium]|nr:hypothetical protein [Planctomycetota bacterium]
AAGALAMLFALLPSRRGRIPVPLFAVIISLAVWQVVASIAGGFFARIRNDLGVAISAAFNPYLALFEDTVSLYTPGRVRLGLDWPLHCALMAGLSALLLLLAIRGARSALERHAFPPERRAAKEARTDAAAAGEPSRVSERPVYWKDARPGRRRRQRLALLVAGIAVVGTCAAWAWVTMPMFSLLHLPLQIAWLFAVIVTSVLAARSIASEKEGRTWALVLATPLSDGRIVREKAFGVLHRTAFLWVLFLAGDAIIAALASLSFGGGFGVIYLAQAPVVLAGQLLFLLGAGLYFSVRCRTSAAATAFTLACMLGWCLFDWLMARVAIAIVARFAGIPTWPFAYMLANFLPEVLLDIALGLLFLRAARRRLRRSVW